jgi:hypothetical protein
MALSLAGGVAFALILVLYFVPVLYSYYTDIFVPNNIEFQNDQIDLPKTEPANPALT